MATQQDTLDVFGEGSESLVESLQSHEESTTIRRHVASRLERAAYSDRELLGVLADEQRAVYYSGKTRCIAAVPFSLGDLSMAAARPLGQAIDDPTAWMRHCADEYEWAWRSPRFR